MEALCLLLGLIFFMHAAILLFYALAPFFMSLFALAAMPSMEEGAVFFEMPLLFSAVSFATALALFGILKTRNARYALAGLNTAAAAFLLWSILSVPGFGLYKGFSPILHVLAVPLLLIGREDESRKGHEDREGPAHYRVHDADALPDEPASAPERIVATGDADAAEETEAPADMPDMVEWLEMQAATPWGVPDWDAASVGDVPDAAQVGAAEMRGAMKTADELHRNASLFYLGSVDAAGFPNVKAMLPPKGRESIRVLHFGTNTSSLRVHQFRANPKACVYYADPVTFEGVMLSGVVEVLEDAIAKRRFWSEGDEQYYPRGVTDPDYCILRFTPRKGRYYRDFHSEDFIF